MGHPAPDPWLTPTAIARMMVPKHPKLETGVSSIFLSTAARRSVSCASKSIFHCARADTQSRNALGLCIGDPSWIA